MTATHSAQPIDVILTCRRCNRPMTPAMAAYLQRIRDQGPFYPAGQDIIMKANPEKSLIGLDEFNRVIMTPAGLEALAIWEAEHANS